MLRLFNRPALLLVLFALPLISGCPVNRQGVKAAETTVKTVLDYPPPIPPKRIFQSGFTEPPKGDWEPPPKSITDVTPQSSGYTYFAARCWNCHNITPSQLKNIKGLQWIPIMERHKRYQGVQVTPDMARKILYYLMMRTADDPDERKIIEEKYRYDAYGQDFAKGLPPRDRDRYFWNIFNPLDNPSGESPPEEQEQEGGEAQEEGAKQKPEEEKPQIDISLPAPR